MPGLVGMGTVLAVSSSTGALSVGGVRSIGGPEADGPAVDVTSMDSTGHFRVFLGGGPIDGGEVPLELVYKTSDIGQARLTDYLYSGAVKNYTITFNTTASKTHTFAAIVTRFGQSMDYEGAVMRTITLKVTKTPAFTT